MDGFTIYRDRAMPPELIEQYRAWLREKPGRGAIFTTLHECVTAIAEAPDEIRRYLKATVAFQL